jgi:hypothetical protein
MQGIKDTADADPESDLRSVVKQWLELYAPEVAEQLDFGDMDAGEAPAEDPVAAPEAGGEAPAEEPQMASDDPEERNQGKMNVQELAEFIHTFYDRDSGTFPKGPEGVCTMVGKKFGEQAENVARKMVERMAPEQQDQSMNELARIRQLSGM